MIKIKVLKPERSKVMAEIAKQAHSHPMSEKLIQSCFGGLYHVFGIEEDNALLGFGILHLLFEEVTLIDICLHPKAQGRGLGKQLLEHLISYATDNGAEVMLLEVRASGDRAIGLYQSLGFNSTGVRPGYYKTSIGSEDAVLMSLQLKG